MRGGEWYWRAEVYVADGKSATVWAGWATRDTASATVMQHPAALTGDPSTKRVETAPVSDTPSSPPPIGAVKIRSIRKPHMRDPTRRYWRAEVYRPETQKSYTLWTGWATEEEAEAKRAELEVEP